MKQFLILITFTFLVVPSFAKALPESPHYQSYRIAGIPGPEDFAVTTLGTTDVLLISSDERLNPNGIGNIYLLEKGTDAALVLPRFNEPDTVSFHPHGVDVSQSPNGETVLWVITHRSSGDGAAHAILAYEVKDDGLYYQFALESPLLVSPNDLHVADDGRIYVSNDSSGNGGFAETAFSLKRSSVVMFDDGVWAVVAEKLAFANGIYGNEGKLYVAATRQNAVFAFDVNSDGSLSTRIVLARIKGPDNIMPFGEKLIVSAHTKTLALVRHMNNQTNPSPSVVYQVDKYTGEMAVLFSDDGFLISAASTAAYIGDELYVGQIVGPTLVRLQPE